MGTLSRAVVAAVSVLGAGTGLQNIGHLLTGQAAAPSPQHRNSRKSVSAAQLKREAKRRNNIRKRQPK